jgi:TfoX/Sxy family transcriptional regulator of competence genes
VAFDEALAERVRDRVRPRDGGAERRMFGGLCFLDHGNMTVGVMGDDLLVRVGAEAKADALASPGSREFDFTGKPMKGFVVVDGSVLDDDILDGWIDRAYAFVATLPPK